MGSSSIFSNLSAATPVAKAVLALLVLMSLYSWALMIYKFFALRRACRKAQEGLGLFGSAKSIPEGITRINDDAGSPVYQVAQEGVAEWNRLSDAGSSPEVVLDNVRRALSQGVSSEMSSFRSSLSGLATMANTAPFIGLFGTVWGIMHSFHSIGLAQSASLGTVAPGISEALIATAMGLFVAVPATVGYNMFLGMLDRVEVLLINFASVFLNRVHSEVDARVHAPKG